MSTSSPCNDVHLFSLHRWPSLHIVSMFTSSPCIDVYLSTLYRCLPLHIASMSTSSPCIDVYLFTLYQCLPLHLVSMYTSSPCNNVYLFTLYRCLPLRLISMSNSSLCIDVHFSPCNPADSGKAVKLFTTNPHALTRFQGHALGDGDRPSREPGEEQELQVPAPRPVGSLALQEYPLGRPQETRLSVYWVIMTAFCIPVHTVRSFVRSFVQKKKYCECIYNNRIYLIEISNLDYRACFLY